MTFQDLPNELKREAVQTAKEQLGSGYTPDAYISVINDWLWLYEAGRTDRNEADPVEG